ncbi:MAG: hypothetical protein DI582_08890 [Azospirillum brasilense]|nr:MAG: hypothetical protein DI582_08890 [Azospirillum brasilense]
MLSELYKLKEISYTEDEAWDCRESGDGGWGEVYKKAKNTIFNQEEAKYWERVADHLEGKTTPHEREKFLTEFLYSQDGTPEGLYNIGYALFHNEHIGNKPRGLDYLKHAANLGNANAARELGEIYHDRFDSSHHEHDLQIAHFWYKAAADLGHPNGKARQAFLETAHPVPIQKLIDEKQVRNPSAGHVRQYPASAWYVDVPITDVTNILRDTSRGGMVKRLEHAVSSIDQHVAEFENTIAVIQARAEELVQRQALLDRGVESEKAREIDAIRHNEALSEKQRSSERAMANSQNRWVKETTKNMGATLVLSYFSGGGHMILSNSARAMGYHGVMSNEVDYHQSIIDELEARKIDTRRFPDEIRALTEEVQRVIDSGPIQNMLKDQTRARALVEGYLRQRVLKAGLDSSRALQSYAQQAGLESVDVVLEAFQYDNPDLHVSLKNLCEGHANSRDMAILLADVNALQGNDLQPHEQAVKRFVERVVKGNIAHYMTRASQIDVIQDLELIHFDTMTVNHRATNVQLIAATQEPSVEVMGQRQVDAATHLALTSMFSKQFGVTHIGQYDVGRMFSFYLHRHGKDELIAAELHDGTVSDTLAPKRVSARTNKQIRGFIERAKESAIRGREDLPDIGDLFLRTCAYEYYLPQAVITSGRGNRFKENPEAPVAYPMVNDVIHDFVRRMSLTDMAHYREQVGEELDAVIAQTFIDFFQEIGKVHQETMRDDREYLQDAFTHQNYGPRFTMQQDKITHAVKQEFPLFLEIYERNLTKSLEILPDEDAKLLMDQLNALQSSAQYVLNPSLQEQGSYQAREAARQQDHRGKNMTERWAFRA